MVGRANYFFTMLTALLIGFDNDTLMRSINGLTNLESLLTTAIKEPVRREVKRNAGC